MAEGFARARGQNDVEITSAGTMATSVHPMAARVMDEVGFNIGQQQSKSLADIASSRFDIVITLCDQAAQQCPFLAGNPLVVKWNLPDPAAVSGDEQTGLEAFRGSRDRIRGLVEDLFERGYLSALAESKRCESVILDTISDGILAHDMQRRIFCFNRAAEEITGYSSDEVLNRKCDEVFDGGFCSGRCQFTKDTPPVLNVDKQEMEIATKGGARRTVEVSIRPLRERNDARQGVFVSFHDITHERRLARRVGEIQQFAGIVGNDAGMLEVFDLIRELAEINVPVLIQGESGTGKELVAAAIHSEGPRANKLFVPVNCGALPEGLLESELFGHVKGSFTGAIRDKKGRFELADGGTIFLDEIGDISPTMQVKLLRVLQEGHFEPVGSEKTHKVDVRIVSATNKDIAEEIAAGRFREDLYYRLSVVPIRLPPLRERRNDIPLLVQHILAQAIKDSGRNTGVTLSPDALDVMMSYDWPGNIRELQNWIQFSLVKCRKGAILPSHLPPARLGSMRPIRKRRLRKLDATSVREAIEQTQGNKLEAAKLLGVSRATLYRFLDDMDVSA